MAKKKVVPGHEKSCSAVPVNGHLRSLLKDPAFKKQCEAHWKKIELVKPVIGYRISHNLSQKQLARKAGVMGECVCEIEDAKFKDKAALKKVLCFVKQGRK